MKPKHVFYAFRPELREQDLPPGVIGQVAGIALVYDVIDSLGSTFVRGALERTIRERVAAGKVKLFWDHGDSAEHGMYDTDLHIGTVRSITDIQLEDGRWAAYMVADLIDTAKGHEAKRYLKSLLGSGGETGLSVGCVGALIKGIKSSVARINGDPVERITEFPLSEISITSMQAVPDSEVMSVRAELAAAADSSAADPEPEPQPEIALADGTVVGTAVLDEPADAPAAEPIAADPAAEPPLPRFELEPEAEPLVIRSTRASIEAAFDVLLVALPAATVRARVRAVLGDADPKDSDAAAAHPQADSDAEAQDSRTTTAEDQPVVYATMEERMRALRTCYAEAPYQSCPL